MTGLFASNKIRPVWLTFQSQTVQMLHPDQSSTSLSHEDFWDYLLPITDLPIEARLSQAAWPATPKLVSRAPPTNVCLAPLFILPPSLVCILWATCRPMLLFNKVHARM